MKLQAARLAFPILFCAALLLQPVVTDARKHGADQAVTVELSQPRFDIKIFDPEHMPNPAPPIPAGLHAVTPYNFSCYQESWMVDVGKYTDSGGSVHIEEKPESLKIKVGLSATTWLPNNAPEKLKEHEAGHVEIYKTVFEQRAERAAKTACDEVIGQVFQGSGPDLASARGDVQHKVTLAICTRFHQLTRDLASKVDVLYDGTTDHGRNKASTSQSVKQSLDAVLSGAD